MPLRDHNTWSLTKRLELVRIPHHWSWAWIRAGALASPGIIYQNTDSVAH